MPAVGMGRLVAHAPAGCARRPPHNARPPAGLTHDTNELDADPTRIEDAISLPNATALLSLALPAATPPGAAGPDGQGGSEGEPPLLRHCAQGQLVLGRGCPGGGGASPLDATFRMAPPLAGCQAGDSSPSGDGCSPAAARQLLMQPAQGGGGGEDGALHEASSAEDGTVGPSSAGLLLASFEAASAPGHFLTADAATGRLVLRQARSQPAAAQTFRLHTVPEGDDSGTPGGRPQTFELEPLSQPGTRIQLAGSSPAGSLGLVVAPHADSAGATFHLAPPAAPAYPRGARVLHGHNRDYLLVPLGQASSTTCRVLAAAWPHGQGTDFSDSSCMLPAAPVDARPALQGCGAAQAATVPPPCLAWACRSWTNPTPSTSSS